MNLKETLLSSLYYPYGNHETPDPQIDIAN